MAHTAKTEQVKALGSLTVASAIPALIFLTLIIVAAMNWPMAAALLLAAGGVGFIVWKRR